MSRLLERCSYLECWAGGHYWCIAVLVGLELSVVPGPFGQLGAAGLLWGVAGISAIQGGGGGLWGTDGARPAKPPLPHTDLPPHPCLKREVPPRLLHPLSLLLLRSGPGA